MFASSLPSWTASLRRAAALVKAFALLEDTPRGANDAAPPRRPTDPMSRRLGDAAAHGRPADSTPRRIPDSAPRGRPDAGTRGRDAGAGPRRLADIPPLRLHVPAAAAQGAAADLRAADLHGLRSHPHRRALRATRERREGAVVARPAACTVPVVRSEAGTRGASVQNARWAAQRAAHR